MPKTPMDYSKTIIYKIQHREKEELIYVGHTTNFDKRKHQHKNLANNSNPDTRDFNILLYKLIRENGGWDSFKMIQVKEFCCQNRREASAEEDKILLDLKATMNKNRASRSDEEYNIENRAILNEKSRVWRETHREEAREKCKKWHNTHKEEVSEKNKEKMTCECGSIFRSHEKLRHFRSLKHKNFISQ